jgi:hypothetical protein
MLRIEQQIPSIARFLLMTEGKDQNCIRCTFIAIQYDVTASPKTDQKFTEILGTIHRSSKLWLIRESPEG